VSTTPGLTPVEVNLLTAADETAREHKAAVLDAAEHAGKAMGFDMLPLARQWLTEALAELDALEARLTEIRGQR
jgi:hypothetical protein